MKRIIFFTFAAMLAGIGTAYSQNFMVVNSEKVFKASAAYNKAIADIDNMAKGYQKTVDDAYAEIEQMYNAYQSQKQYLSATARQAREDAIINKEKEVNKYQEDIFGQEGTLMKKRLEVIKPIQDKIFGVVNHYAETNGFQVVLDIAASPMVLYYSPKVDRTEQIITLIK